MSTTKSQGSTKKEKPQSLEDAIVDLYLNVKIRNSEDIENFDEEQFEKEKVQLKRKDPFLIIEYIRSSVEILMNLKLEEHEIDEIKKENSGKMNNSDISLDDPPKDYEIMLQKLEAEIRNHIRTEQQLKLYIENIQYKMEEAEKGKSTTKSKIEELKRDGMKLREELRMKDKENQRLKVDLNTKTTEVDSLEDKLKIIESQFLDLQIKYEREMDKIRSTIQQSKKHEGGYSRIQSINTEDKGKHFTSNDFADLKLIKRDHLTRNSLSISTDKRSTQSKLINRSTNEVYKVRLPSTEAKDKRLSRDFHNRIYSEVKPKENLDLIVAGKDISKSPSANPRIEGSPYIPEFYKKKVENKKKELMKLKSKLFKLHNEMQKSRSREQFIYTNNFVDQTSQLHMNNHSGGGNNHKRSKSQSITMGKATHNQSVGEPQVGDSCDKTSKDNPLLNEYIERNKQNSRTAGLLNKREGIDTNNILINTRGEKKDSSFISSSHRNTDLNVSRDRSVKKSRPGSSHGQIFYQGLYPANGPSAKLIKKITTVNYNKPLSHSSRKELKYSK